ncbi:glycerophosphodiester phosphodiesterase family protein [Actinoplanes sp. NPDC000266]
MRTPLLAGLAVLALTGAIAAVPHADQPAGHHSAESPGKLLLRHGPGAPVMVAAHRGYWRGAPENSIGAITQAVSHGAQIVEIDVQRTSDGELVLMHDDTVNRATNGTGRVADLTLAQIKALRLREGLGGGQAAVTGDTVPTLREAMQAVRRGGTLVNLDKAWAFRDQIYDLLAELGQVGQGLFKSSAPVAEVTAFLEKDPRILYSHVVDDGNAGDVGAFTGRRPQAYELIFDRLTDPQIQPAAVARARATSRVWINTMWYGLAAGYTDEASLRDPALGWASVVDRHGADMIQTDDEDNLNDWLQARSRGRAWPSLPEGTVRVQAEDYSTAGKDVGYHDADDANSGGAARKYEGVDIGDNAGAIVVGWIRAGEWMRYDVTVPRTGDYRITARVSSPYRPAGRFTLDFGAGGVTAPVDVVTTTSHNAFTEQPVVTKRLTRGEHTFFVRIDATAYQNFNLDYIEFTRV